MKNILTILVIALLASCAGSNEHQTNSEDSTSTVDTHQAPPVVVEQTATPEVAFKCISKGEGESGEPKSDIMISINGKETKVASILNCITIEKTDYTNYHIPAEAIAAGGGFWTGSGDYFYAAIENGEVVVYGGVMGETDAAVNIKYEKKGTYPTK